MSGAGSDIPETEPEVRHGLRVYRVGEVRAQLRSLHLTDDVEGMIEGSPWMHRRFRLREFERRLAEGAGFHVYDLAGIRADEAARVDTFLPRTRVSARLTSDWTPSEATVAGHTELTVLWFQEITEDPFARLAGIVRPLDWAALALFRPNLDF